MANQGPLATMRIKVLGGEAKRKKVHRVHFKLLPMDSDDDDNAINLEAWTVDNVCAPLNAVQFDMKKCHHLKNLSLADTFPRKAVSVDLLVGADQYHRLVHGAVRKGKPGTPVATKSKLGWLLSGPVPGSGSKENDSITMLTITKLEDPQTELRRFWELDAIGLIDEPKN